MDSIVFEEVSISDSKSLYELHDLVADEVTRRLGDGYWSTRRPLARIKEMIHQQGLTSDGRRIYVYRRGDSVLASITLSQRLPWFWKRELWSVPLAPALGVFDLAVRPSHFRKGIGRAAMSFAEGKAVQAGLEWVRLDAFARNPDSNAFYDSLGYSMRGQITINGITLNQFERRMTTS